VTPFSPEPRLHLQNVCFPEDVIVIAEHSGLRRQAGSGLSS
jgi:hypothetical protein